MSAHKTPRKLGFFSAVALVAVGALVPAPSVYAQIASGLHGRSRIVQGINETDRVALTGNTHPEARTANDRGPVENAFAMEHMLLQLKRSSGQELALQQFLGELHNPGSPDFHHWLTAQEFGERFGVANSDISAVTSWLQSRGFKVNVVYPSGMLIDFSGTAAQVRKAFQTEIHYLAVKGQRHIGNMSDPRIPAALAPVVAGVVSLHDFRPHTMHHLRKVNRQFTSTDILGDVTYAVVPADLAKIYNLNALFSAGISGQDQTIALIEDSDVFSSSDWNTFRQTFGLASYSSGSFTQIHPPAPPPLPGNNCAAPGAFAPNEAEAVLDAEWASASAPSAAIEMASCKDTSTTFGGLIAIQNLINANTPPPSIISISYGQCETVNGAAANAAYNSAYQQAVAEGVSVFVAAGDSGAAGCDNSAAEATHGIAVNAFASTPNNVAVGGTDFSDTYSATNLNYWNSTNTPTFGSAISYLPEIPWNDSCAGQLLSNYLGYSPTYGSTSLCNDPLFGSFFASTVAGGGGPSKCASGAPSTTGVVSGSCAGWAKPSWQTILGNPSDGVRDTPDVSLFAADGLWSHFYVFCWSDTASGGAACGSDPSAWSGAGGTSFASPIMAGIQALINQKAGGPQGNPAPVYYQLAAAEYGSSGNSSCNSDNGNGVGASCIFYDVTSGDMDVDCVGPDCYLADGTVGVLSTSNTSFAPAYGTNVGWDFATGIGTVNAANLVNNWPSSAPQPSFTLSASPATLMVLQGSFASTTITINPANGFNSSVTLSASGVPSGVTATFGTNPATASSSLTLTASGSAAIGTFTVTVIGTSGALSSKTTVPLTVNPAGDYILSASPSSMSIAQSAKGTSTITVTPLNGFNGSLSLSATGLPSGVTAAFNPSSTTSTSTLTLTASSTAALGTVTINITGKSGALSHSTTLSLTVTPLPNFALSASPNSLSLARGTKVTSTITVTGQNGFTGSVSLTASGLPRGVTASFNSSTTTATSTLTLSATNKTSIGTFSIVIHGASGSLTHTTTISLKVH
jgi:subtilase family serine protease